jgi:hypothetical protein
VGAVETWCDDTGNCELRVTTGGVFPCRSVGSSECLTAAMMATEACLAGGASDAGTVDGAVVTDPCSSICAGCPDLCSECRSEQSRYPSCNASLANMYACIRMRSCDPAGCEADAEAHAACTCSLVATRLASEAALCGQSVDTDCATPTGAIAARRCESAFEADGCLAFTSPLCDPCFGAMSCGGVCTDVRADETNCGRCGNVCPTGATCMSGTCASTTCSVAGASGAFPPLPPACLPRCSSATRSALAMCTSDPCAQMAVSADTTPGTTLDRGGGMTTTIRCRDCYNWQLNSCAEEICPSQFAAYVSCAAAGDPSTIGSRCSSQIGAVNACLMANSATYSACFDSRVSMCF